tara:strand:- start:1497 stop:2483 length:987 start_codon:yes stop_codon:yes gene_type:complete
MNNFNKYDPIFIAGASGLAGSAICRSLRNHGFNNLLTPRRRELDLTNYVDVKKWFSINKPKVVILCAAKVGGILANYNYPADFILENLKIQNNVIELSWKSNVKRFIFLGSSCIYPKYAKQPISEDSLLTGQLENTNRPYAIAKISGIELCESLRKQYGFNAISLMPTNLYGPGDNYLLNESHVLPALVRRFSVATKKSKKEVLCWGSGNPLREFLFSDDLGNATIFLLKNWNTKNEIFFNNNYDSPLIFNIGSGSEISIKELANKIAKLTGFKGEIIWDKSKPDGTPRKLLDISKIKKIGWEPKINLKEGLKNVIKDFQINHLENYL